MCQDDDVNLDVDHIDAMVMTNIAIPIVSVRMFEVVQLVATANISVGIMLLLLVSSIAIIRCRFGRHDRLAVIVLLSVDEA